MTGFYKEILLSITRSLNNYYPSNFDWEIRKLGLYRKAIVVSEMLIDRMKKIMGRSFSVLVVAKSNVYLRSIEQYETTFELLKDEESKKKYIELLTYKILGFTKVKLSLNNEAFWSSRSKIDAYKRPEKLSVQYGYGHLDLYDLTDAGYNLKLFFLKNGIFVDFILQQYNYQDLVCVNQGDIVIDAGGCWGDTALYFAVRGAAQIFVYEFIPSNVEILEKNVALNPQYEGQITLVKKAVWESSGLDLSFDDSGPSSCVAEKGRYAGETRTLSIDDLVDERNLSQVDFIKMDIEGAELSALKGAANTIRKHKPKLAISVYHKPDDLVLIPEYIQSLNPGYDFYLDYYTIVGDEIILYAIDKHGK